MSGDCGHGWGYHYDGPSGPCYKCKEKETEERIADLERQLAEKQDEQMKMTSAAIAHRACCGTEHAPMEGKLHGYCVVCGVPWPCETASAFLFARKPK